MDKETQWNIIVKCSTCPVIRGFPLHRIISTSYTNDFVNHVKDLIRNPNFKKMEFLKHTKMNDGELAHLANTSIHFTEFPRVTLGAVELAALISFNTQGMGTKLILHQFDHNTDLWNSLWSEYGLMNSTIQIRNTVQLSPWLITSLKYCKKFVGNEKQKIVLTLTPLTPAKSPSSFALKEVLIECLRTNEPIYNAFKYYNTRKVFIQNCEADVKDENLFRKKKIR